jgi:hypothetical protein
MYGNRCSFLNVRDQVSGPYKATEKIIGLYVLMFIFLDSKLEGRFWTEWEQAFPEFVLLLIELISSLFWDVTQRMLVIVCCRFGTAY